MNQKKWLNYLLSEQKEEPKFDPSLMAETIFDSLSMQDMTQEEIDLLLEGRKDKAREKWAMSPEQAAGEAPGSLSSEGPFKINPVVFEKIANNDEKYNYKHLEWMLKQISGSPYGSVQEQDYYELEPVIEDFVRYKQQMEKKDINQYKTRDELLDAIQSDVIAPRVKKAKEKRMSRPGTKEMIRSGDANIVYEDDRFFVVRPFSEESSCHFGSKTKWCISQTGNSYFNSYSEEEGKIFYFIKDDTLREEDAFVKLAVQVTSDMETSPTIEFEMFWDRFDDSYEHHTEDSTEFAEYMSDETSIPLETAYSITAAIYEHAEENPPEASKLIAIEERINDQEFDSGFVQVHADIDEYLSVFPSLVIKWPLMLPALIKKLDGDEYQNVGMGKQFVLEELEAELKEHLDDSVQDANNSGLLHDILKEAGIYADYYFDSDDEWTVNIFRRDKFWLCEMSTYLKDSDHGNYYTNDSADTCITFLEDIGNEFGEGKTDDIIEAFDKHGYRYMSILQDDIEEFVKFKNEFADGQHTLESGNIQYVVADDEDDTSNIGMVMDFKFTLSSEAIDTYFESLPDTDEQGNRISITKLTKSDAIRNIKDDMGANLNIALSRSIQDVYKIAMNHSKKQMKIDFGPDFEMYSEPQAEPELPNEDISWVLDLDYEAQRVSAGRHWNIKYLPDEVTFIIKYVITIPFYKKVEEMHLMRNFILYVDENYSQVQKGMGDYINSTGASDFLLESESTEEGKLLSASRLIESLRGLL